jgi:transcriptional regulator with XRE-family HTH domain
MRYILAFDIITVKLKKIYPFMNFGKQLKRLVKSKGLTFTVLANKIGVNKVYLSQIVIGSRNPGRNTLLKLSNALEVPVDALLMLGADIFAQSSVSRKIPVLNEAELLVWMKSIALDHPTLYAATFEYASSFDPHAFYLQPSDSKSSCLGSYDLILIEPSSAINTGDAVLSFFHGVISLGKIVIAQGLASLLNGKQEQILLLSDVKNSEGIKLFRALQGIKNI